MNSLKKFSTLLAMLGLAAFIGCSEDAPSDLPKAGLGGVTINKYVAVGNSLAAGYQSSGLYKSAQLYSYPNLIAGQLKAAGANIGTFEQPYWPDPGNPDATGKAARYRIISLADPNNPVIGPAGEAITASAPENAGTLNRPYDNLGIPGAVIYDFLDTTNFITKATARVNPFFPNILRSSAFGANILMQAKALSPNLVTFWLGNNDVLGYATSGGTSPSAPTSTAIFTALYNQALDSLKKSVPGVKIAVATIPNVTTIPFFTTIGPKVGAKLVAAGGLSLYFQKGTDTGPGTGSTKFSAPASDPLICLTGSPYAGLIGTPTAKFYRDVAASKNQPFSAVIASVIASGIDTTKPFGLHPQNPWPNALTLDADEIAKANQAVADFNNVIKTAAAAQGAAVADMNALFTDIKANGRVISGVKYTTDYITGGLFSLDGVHPSNRGAGVAANEFIAAINAKFGTSITGVNISNLPALEIPLGKYMTNLNAIPSVAPKNWDSFLSLWQN